MKTKYIFVVGGVISGLGKGITSASIGRLLKDTGFKVTNVKFDAYVNVDAGTMNPTEHGEVFVTADGMETDQDVGNYERFLSCELSKDNYGTTGQIYSSLISKERNLEFGGKCVEVVPHVPLEIIDRIKNAAKKNKAEVVIIEVGGTVGEYQNILFLEAARMLKCQNPGDVAVLLVSYAPVPKMLGEMKTKPTQYASRSLNETGIQADFIVCRGDYELDEPRKEKIALLCNMESAKDIFSAPNVDNIYKVPIMLYKQGLLNRITKKLRLKKNKTDLSKWNDFISRVSKNKPTLNIGVVGKYFHTGSFILSDVYISVIEAIKHAGWHNGVDIKLTWIDSEQFEKNKKNLNMLSEFSGIVVPGGFGTRGVNGIIAAIEYARVNKIPYLGLCYGMQLASIEFARNVAGIREATTQEISLKDNENCVIHIMSDQEKKMLSNAYGGTMRLGNYPTKIKKGTHAYDVYKKELVNERHRHRYEFNNKFKDILEKNGLIISGTSPEGKIVEIVELNKKDHPFFVGVQFHPEFKSWPLKPHPLFAGFIKAAKNKTT